jgi:hypothetical protein
VVSILRHAVAAGEGFGEVSLLLRGSPLSLFDVLLSIGRFHHLYQIRGLTMDK